MKPKVLIVATFRWIPTARLACAFAESGFEVAIVCPTGHPVLKVGVCRQTYHYHGLAGLWSVTHAISDYKPDLIVPGDDVATEHLHRLYGRAKRNGKAGLRTCNLIEKSIGAHTSFAVSSNRKALMQVAEGEGVRVPHTERIRTPGDLASWGSRIGFPSVLKVDGTAGGEGVRVVHSLAEAAAAFRLLNAPPLLAKATKRALVDRDSKLLWPSLLRRRSTVNAQVFVAGREATSVAACWQGTVLAALHFEVLQRRYANGPATVLRLIDHFEITPAVMKITKRLRLSGFYGFDFVLESRTDRAYLIEMNPRTTQVGHLAMGSGRDLPVALYSALTGRSHALRPKVTENDTIALFPHEWLRDPESEFLSSAYHDVPWEEPALVRDSIHGSEKWNAFRDFARRALAPARVSPPELQKLSERVQQFDYICSND